MTILDRPEWIAPIVSVLHIALAAIASAHIILTKRDVRAAIGWIGLVWLSPFLGTAVYAFFGINHIRRKAKTSRKKSPRPTRASDSPSVDLPEVASGTLAPLVTFMDRVTGRSLTPGNALVPLSQGGIAYDAMIEAIASAERSIGLSSYIFNYDSVGKRFVDALADAGAGEYKSESWWTTLVRIITSRRSFIRCGKRAFARKSSCRRSCRSIFVISTSAITERFW